MTQSQAQMLLDMLRSASPDATGLWPSGCTIAVNDVDDPAAFAALAVLLESESDSVRANAAWVLGYAGNPEALETLEPLLRDKSPNVRLRAAEAVAKFGAVDDMIPALAQLIAADPNPLTRLLAIHALYITRDHPDAVAALRTASGDSDTAVRDAALRMIAGQTPWTS